MLIQFSVENYRSIWGRQTLSMAASTYFKELEQLNTFNTGLDEKMPRLLRSSVIYGPNASGKSTLVLALDFMRSHVINSAKESQADEEIPIEPFKLTAVSRSSDSEFEISFIEEGIRYQYGFRCNKRRVTEEWLFAYPKGRPQKWFHRIFDQTNCKDEYRFSTTFLGGRKRQDWKEQTRPNALFLSTALLLNSEQLKPVLSWFQKRLRVVEAHQFLSPNYTMTRCRDDAKKQRVLEFLNSAGLSISDIQIDTRTFSPDILPKDIPASVRDELVQKMAGKEMMKAAFFHEDIETREPIEFSLDEESDGTRALFAFAGPWLDVVENERILIVDELDTSLHPLIVHHLVKLLHCQTCKAQIVFTTHDTTILSQRILRRDQIWFMEKDAKNSSQLYPLSDYSPRDNEAIERGYLNGRYGGIPFLQDLDFYGQG
ncbi:MAG: ATP-binding protein [Betaproteobacteria bacterium]|nr:ATP-binding protein [Betaproteobacteria bacterium]